MSLENTPLDALDRLADEEYDDGQWKAEEMDVLREESVAMLDNFGNY